MNDTIAQKARSRQSIIKYALRHGVTAAAVKFGVSRQYSIGGRTVTTARSKLCATVPDVRTAIPICRLQRR